MDLRNEFLEPADFDADELGIDPEDEDEDVCSECELPWDECTCDEEEGI